MKLSKFTQGRDNNFNLIRIIAALAVLVTHSFALSIGRDAEPFRESLGMTMGSIAVDIFFIASGFLVTASIVTRQCTIEFIWARVLRIFPALVLMVLLTVFVLGTLFTSLPLPSYLTNSITYIYLIKCTTLISGVAFNLPGVFENNPYKNDVNSSLWTLTYEIRMYAILAILWGALQITNKIRSNGFVVIIITSTIAAAFFVITRHFYPAYFPPEGNFARLFLMFFSGASFYVMKERITLSRSLFWSCVIALMLSFLVNKDAIFLVYIFTIAYVLFYIAYIPAGPIRKYNVVGDYSYGVYIYAFPVQQSIAALVPGVSVLSMILISFGFTLLFAVLSWHFLEKPALSLKNQCVVQTKRILNNGIIFSSQK